MAVLRIQCGALWSNIELFPDAQGLSTLTSIPRTMQLGEKTICVGEAVEPVLG